MTHLVEQRFYLLEGMRHDMWDMSHEKYGQPDQIIGLYLGSRSGTRTWHLFEIRTGSGDEGVLLMNDSDIDKLKITEVIT